MFNVITACAAGTFGWNCLEKCGKCRGGAACDRVTGLCPADCEDGYMGTIETNCSMGKELNIVNIVNLYLFIYG